MEITVCIVKMHGGTCEGYPTHSVRACVCGIDMYVSVPTGAREANQVRACVFASGQMNLSTGDVSGFEMHGFSMVAAGRVSFPDESKETPTLLSSSFLLKVGQRGLPLDRGARSSSS